MKRLVLLIIIFSVSCAPVKYAGKKAPKKVYEEFFVDQGVFQYFLKPLKFTSKNYQLEIDFTFRDSIPYEGDVTANFSVYSKDLVKKIDKAYFFADGKQIEFKSLEKMFIDKAKKGYEIRYTSKITLAELFEFCRKIEKINIQTSDKIIELYPVKSVKKSLNTFNKQVLDIIELNKE